MEIKKYKNFISQGTSQNKYQIAICHSSRNFNDYISSLEYRFNKKYNRIPNYLISREGKIFQLLENDQYSKIFSEDKLNKNSIVISLENLGWLNKEPLKDYYVNWIGDIYNGKVVDKKWRDYFYWQPYTETQMISLSLVCKKIINEMGLEKEIVGHNTKINGVENFEGIVTRSNFDSVSTDVSPAFDFDYFSKLLNDEQ